MYRSIASISRAVHHLRSHITWLNPAHHSTIDKRHEMAALCQGGLYDPIRPGPGDGVTRDPASPPWWGGNRIFEKTAPPWGGPLGGNRPPMGAYPGGGILKTAPPPWGGSCQNPRRRREILSIFTSEMVDSRYGNAFQNCN